MAWGVGRCSYSNSIVVGTFVFVSGAAMRTLLPAGILRIATRETQRICDVVGVGVGVDAGDVVVRDTAEAAKSELGERRR